MTSSRLRAAGRCAAALSLFLAGCTGAPATGTVEGKVTFDNQPLPNAIITFLAEGQPAIVVLADDAGRYRADGVAVGPVKVGVDLAPENSVDAGERAKVQGQDPDARAKAAMGPGARPKGNPKAPRIPPRYLDPLASPLNHTVTPGTSTFNIDLAK